MRLLKTRHLAAVLVAAGAVAVAAGAQAAQAKLSLAKVKVAMPFTVLVQRAALEGAVRAGEFKREGLAVEIVGFRSWTEPVQSLAADAAQFALGGGSFIRASLGGKAPVRAIALVSSRYPYAFWVRKASGIKSLKDVRGKTIQTVRAGETLDNVWKQMLATAGLKITDVERFESFNGFGSLMSGNADIANISSNWIGKARSRALSRSSTTTTGARNRGCRRTRPRTSVGEPRSRCSSSIPIPCAPSSVRWRGQPCACARTAISLSPC